MARAEGTLPLPDLIGLADAAKLLGISDDTVGRLADDGTLPRSGHGAYIPAELVAAYVLHRSDGGGLKSVELNEKIKKLRRENAVAASKLYPADMVHVTVGEMMAIMAMGLEALSGRLASELCPITDPGEMRERLRAEHTRVRNEAAERFGRIASDAEAVASSPEGDTGAPDTDIRPVGGHQKGTAKGKRGARTVSQ